MTSNTPDRSEQEGVHANVLDVIRDRDCVTVSTAVLADKEVKNVEIIMGPEICAGLDRKAALSSAKFCSQVAKVVHLLVNFLDNFSVKESFKIGNIRLDQRCETKLLGFKKNHTAARDSSR